MTPVFPLRSVRPATMFPLRAAACPIHIVGAEINSA